MEKVEYELLLDEFLYRWPLTKIEKMTLEDYVGIGKKDTFCQWVETKTRLLGSIKGLTSIKFGIYERKDTKKKPQKYKSDDKYSWLKDYGENREVAFTKTKNEIIHVIKFANLGKFELIDSIDLPDLFKWKVAFLYSNERLIPIYKRDVLIKIAKYYGLRINKETKVSEIHKIMISKKPSNFTVYTFMHELFEKFGGIGNEEIKKENNNTTRRTQRRSASIKKIEPQFRTISRSFIVEQKHNKIQETLKRILEKEYGEINVKLEHNFVDIKLLQPEFISFYEVKSSSYATGCIKEALGQILNYSQKDKDERIKKHFVVGQYPPTEEDIKFIDFIKQNLKLEFDYLNVDLE